MTGLLSVRGLTVEYAGRTVLDGVDLDVDAGEAVVVLGGSGSGKSTLLRALLGLVPAPGRVRVGELALRTDAGRIDLTARGAWRRVRGREIGMVFQDPALALTPLRRVHSLLTEVSGDPGRSEPLLRASGFADPAPVAAKRAFELSGGMAQRVGFGLAVAGEPRLVLADEPTTALDGPAREELVTRLRERAAAGTAVVLVTHDVTVAAALADRVAVLHRGRIVEQGTAARVLGDPVHEATRALVRDVPWALPPRRPAPRAGGAPAIRVRGLTRSYAGARVLDGLDLDVGEGEVVGIAGRSGGGKTTLLRCLLGLERPDAGELQLAGIDPAERGWQAVRRAVQLVPQDPRASLNPWRTAAQLVADPLDFHRIGTRAARRARAHELLAAVGLDGAADRRPNALSTGQCQRVAIARALAVRPRVLVADEPASALDVTLQAELIRVLSQVVAEHRMTALVVSHDLHVLERLCDRIAVLDGGRLVEDLPVARLRSDAAHSRTRALLAAYPTDPLAG
ncbi:ABC transporter ATP-binding protein [Pseudonocardia cypriaca]|uniref:Peptide/nickel transport system ATP-binding protein n=1 Tax=Pseudonocardia cypriaca TaxID=882449 RepID=A0A543FQW2_9PSEU|nr:ABC transporter ATP-binding protein [Pseudonocardia cypriaca]TQM36235.1 peptide/nickel transport system ATP-binding protein [Pseudonocardia cypriaca]